MIWVFVACAGLALLLQPFVSEWRKSLPDEAERSAAPGSVANLPKGKTYYRWFGPENGPVVVCVHGLTTPSRVYESIAEALASDGYRVLTYDHYGRGLSDNAAGLQDADFYITHLNELLAHTNVTSPMVLVGYSMGGAIVTTFAAHHPEKVQKVVLLASAGTGVRSNRILTLIRKGGVLGDWLMLRRYPDLHRKGTEAERSLPTSVPGIIDYQQRELGRRGFVPAVLSSIRGILAAPLGLQHQKIAAQHTPLLAVWGRDDDLIPFAEAEDRLRDWNPHAEQVIVDGAGHGLPYTHTAATVKAIRDFLD